MVCPYCNSEQGNNVFCMKCGKKLPQNGNNIPAVKPANPVNSATVSNAGKKQSVVQTALIVLGVASLIFMGTAVVIGGYILKYMSGHVSDVISNNASEEVASAGNSSNDTEADDALNEELEHERQVQADAEIAAAEAEAMRITMQEELDAAKAAATAAEAKAKLAEEQAAAEKAKQEAVAQQAAVAAAQAKAQVASTSSTVSTTANTSSNETMLYCCASDFATLRSQPSTKSNGIVRIKTRQEVAYLGSQGDWYKVRFRGNIGYVLAKFFSTDPNAPLNYDER